MSRQYAETRRGERYPALAPANPPPARPVRAFLRPGVLRVGWPCVDTPPRPGMAPPCPDRPPVYPTLPAHPANPATGRYSPGGFHPPSAQANPHPPTGLGGIAPHPAPRTPHPRRAWASPPARMIARPHPARCTPVYSARSSPPPPVCCESCPACFGRVSGIKRGS